MGGVASTRIVLRDRSILIEGGGQRGFDVSESASQRVVLRLERDDATLRVHPRRRHRRQRVSEPRQRRARVQLVRLGGCGWRGRWGAVRFGWRGWWGAVRFGWRGWWGAVRGGSRERRRPGGTPPGRHTGARHEGHVDSVANQSWSHDAQRCERAVCRWRARRRGARPCSRSIFCVEEGRER